jgi:hypothetical protein
MHTLLYIVRENNFNIIKMHGTTIKIIDAQQAKLCNNYKNTKTVCTALDTHNSLKHMLSQQCKTFNDVFYW